MTSTLPPFSPKEYNYCVYAYFDEIISKEIKKLMNLVQDRFSDVLAYRVTEDPHITVCYGPAITDPSLEIQSFDEQKINSLLGNNFVSIFKCQGDDDQISSACQCERKLDQGWFAAAKLKGVTVFDRKILRNNYIIKIEFECEELDDIRAFLYDQEHNGMSHRREKERQAIFDSGVVDDETYAHLPKRWIHATLAVVSGNVDETKLAEIVAFANDNLHLTKDLVDSDSEKRFCLVKDMTLISAVNDIPIKLFHH